MAKELVKTHEYGGFYIDEYTGFDEEEEYGFEVTNADGDVIESFSSLETAKDFIDDSEEETYDSYEEEGPFGGAFASWDDYYRYRGAL